MRFFRDLKKYYRYAVRSAKSTLKAEVMGSYLNWIWWILNPLAFMLIYAFVFGVIFNAKEQYFNTFIFIGLTLWDFFNHCVTHSVRMIKSNQYIISKVYLPKFVLIIADMMVNAFKMAISFSIVAVMMIIEKVPLTWKALYLIPVLLVLFLFTFAVCTFLMHFGVYVQDLTNVVNIVLRLLFYFTGVFYNVEKRIPEPFNYWVVRGNPMACFLTQARDALLYGIATHRLMLLIWFGIGLLLAIFGVCLIYRNENSYAKVV